MIVCVFCESLYVEGTMICRECKDYKGLLGVAEAVKEYEFLAYLEEELPLE